MATSARVVQSCAARPRRPAAPRRTSRWFSRIVKSVKPKALEDVADRGADLRLDHRRGRADGVHVALVELAEASLARPVGAPDRLNLVALEELRQRAVILRDDARQRHGQVVAQRQIGLARLPLLAALEDLEDEPVALFAVLAEQRLDVLDGRRLERLEPVPLVDVRDDVEDVRALAGRPRAGSRACRARVVGV